MGGQQNEKHGGCGGILECTLPRFLTRLVRFHFATERDEVKLLFLERLFQAAVFCFCRPYLREVVSQKTRCALSLRTSV
jgi:hypothetical protein